MDQNQQLHQALQHIGPAIFLFWGFIYVVKIVLYVIPSWQIAKKAGLSGPIALLAAIPIVGRLIMLYVIAFSKWNVVPLSAVAYPPSYPSPYPPAEYPPQAPPSL